MDRAHALVEGVFGLVRADDCPGGAVVDHLLVRFLWAWSGLSRGGGGGGGGIKEIDGNLNICSKEDEKQEGRRGKSLETG